MAPPKGACSFCRLLFDLLALLFIAITLIRLAIFVLQLFTVLAFAVFYHMRLLVRSLRRALHQIELLQFSNLNKNQPTFPRQINFQQAYLQHLLTQLFADHLKLLKIASLLDRSAVGPVSLVAFITQTLVNLLIVAQLFY
ncbi:MAG: hypothetical protein ACQPRI_06635, partial [Solitalea-like symbiont of Tyrophagus putrescentiae]